MTHDDGTVRRKDVASGSRWSFVATLSKQFGRTALTLILALFLTPTSFGIVSQATLYIALTAIFVDAGFSLAVIQRDRLSDEDVASSFWLTTATAAVFSLFTIGIAPFLADFFDTPEVENVLRVLSITVLLKGLALIPMALLTRRLDLRSVAIAEIVATLIGGTAGISAAAAGADYWAIVIQTIGHDALILAMVWWFAGRIPFRPNVGAMKSIARFGAPVMGAQLVQYGARNADNILVARFEGTEDLAFYGLGYRFVLLPQQLLMQSAARVAVPVFSRLQAERERTARYFRDATSLLVLVIGLIMVGVVATAPELIPLVLGDEWSPASTPMQILAIGGVLQVLPGFTGPLLLGLGRTRANFILMLFSSGSLLTGFTIGLRWGIEGVAMGFTLANIAVVPFAYFLVRKSVGQELWSLLGDLAIMFGAFGAAAATARLAADGLGNATNDLVIVLVAGTTAVAVYGAVLALLRRSGLVRWATLGKQIFSPKG